MQHTTNQPNLAVRMKCTSSDERHIACQLAYIYIKKNSEDNNKTKLKNERHKGSNIQEKDFWCPTGIR